MGVTVGSRTTKIGKAERFIVCTAQSRFPSKLLNQREGTLIALASQSPNDVILFSRFVWDLPPPPPSVFRTVTTQMKIIILLGSLDIDRRTEDP